MVRMWGRVLSCALACAVLAGASALSAEPTAATARTQILFLGTAGGPPLRFDRAEPSTLLIVNGREYLIDFGIGTARRLVDSGIPSSTIRTIFFTHLHADHDMGLADVMAADFFDGGGQGDAGPFDIYGPPETKQLVDAGFQYYFGRLQAFRRGAADGLPDARRELRQSVRDP